tara:strand:+ start:5282 stop:5569 length:288 start_codon:yes stop_codon:yes gene_type:complete
MLDNVMNIKTFIASSELFSYYETQIDITGCKDKEDIIDIFKILLSSLFDDNNLIFLKEKVLKSNWHIHTHTFEEIKTTDKLIYICDGCNCINNNQ